jgi:hypothetical protein
MKTRKCKFCGNDLEGYRSRRYHPECYKKHKRIITNIYVQGKQSDFDAEYARLKAGKTCVCCGKETTGKYCYDCRVDQRKAYKIKYRETHKRTNPDRPCACCGKDTKYKYCSECRPMVKKIFMRVLWETYRTKRQRGVEVYNRKSIDGEILVSDAMFETDLCDMDCARCKYADCILPEEI